MGNAPDDTGKDPLDPSDPDPIAPPPGTPSEEDSTSDPVDSGSSVPSDPPRSVPRQTDPPWGARPKAAPAEEAETGEAGEEWQDGEEGGPVKSFLEHLEDLRWTLIKTGAAILIAMVVCLVAAKHLVGLLEAPLQDAREMLASKEEVVLLKLGTNVLWRLPKVEGFDWPGEVKGTNGPAAAPVKAYKLVPRQIGSNHVFVLERDSDTKTTPSPLPLKNYDPLDPFKVALSLALYGGLGLSSPFVFFFIGQFVVPALKRSEKKYLFQALGIGTVLFVAGVAFCYLVMIKIALHAAVMFAQWMSFSADEWRAGEYISFVCKFMLGMGLAFELPVVLLTLVRIRILDYKTLSKFRIYWVVIEMVFASILTPPDPATMLMMAIPLHILYEFSVVVARYWGKKEEREEAARERELNS